LADFDSTSRLQKPIFILIRLGILLGLGCALNFHSGVKLVNHLTSKNNGMANGIAQAGSTLGAIAVSFAVAGSFSNLDFKTSLLALGSSLLILVPLSACFYWPSKFLSSAEQTSKKCPEDQPAQRESQLKTIKPFRAIKSHFKF